MKELVKTEKLVYVPSCSTRPIRIDDGETQGHPYWFLTMEEFEKTKENGDFLESALVHNKEYYGSRYKDLMDVIDAVDEGDGVVVLTDLFGGTPSNLAISVLGLKHIEVIAGVNVPMILKLLSIRAKDDLATCVTKIVGEGQKHIRVASEFLRANETVEAPSHQEAKRIVKGVYNEYFFFGSRKERRRLTCTPIQYFGEIRRIKWN